MVLGVVLWPDHITLHAVVESDAEENSDIDQLGDQAMMFQITDDLENEYEPGVGGHGSGDSGLNVTEWTINFRSGIAVDATKLTVTIWVRGSIHGTINIPL